MESVCVRRTKDAQVPTEREHESVRKYALRSTSLPLDSVLKSLLPNNASYWGLHFQSMYTWEENYNLTKATNIHQNNG